MRGFIGVYQGALRHHAIGPIEEPDNDIETPTDKTCVPVARYRNRAVEARRADIVRRFLTSPELRAAL